MAKLKLKKKTFVEVKKRNVRRDPPAPLPPYSKSFNFFHLFWALFPFNKSLSPLQNDVLYKNDKLLSLSPDLDTQL